jgi:hypothetical protein
MTVVVVGSTGLLMVIGFAAMSGRRDQKDGKSLNRRR